MSTHTNSIEKANTIPDVYYAVGEGRPLKIDEIDKFYCDTDKVRGDVSSRGKLKRIVNKNAAANKKGHILFVGAKGAGKSTELNHLQKDMLGEFMVVNFSVLEELDPLNINYIELFIVTMEKLFECAETKNLQIADDFLKRVIAWTRSREIEEVREKHISGDAEAGLQGKIGIPYLKEFFFKLKATAKASKSFKETLTNTIEPRLSELINYCNELITEIRIKVLALGKKDVLIIIEDLDKVPHTVAHDVFFDHANQLVLLNANVIYTYPVSLYYNTRFNVINNYFSEVVELPMVKVRDIAGSDHEDGIKALTEVVHARIDRILFASANILRDMILVTGGVLRDLFRMINDAAYMAEERGSATMGPDEYRYAYRELQKEYRNTLSDYSENGTVKFGAGEFYKALSDLAKSTDKKPYNTEILLQLRQNLCVLTYNGENWCDVHPVVKDILKEKGLL